jgi:hypothetical protein
MGSSQRSATLTDHLILYREGGIHFISSNPIIAGLASSHPRWGRFRLLKHPSALSRPCIRISVVLFIQYSLKLEGGNPNFTFREPGNLTEGNPLAVLPACFAIAL